MVALLMGVGAVAGALGAMFGIGGGVLLVPVLVLLFKIPLAEAIPASLACVVASSCGAAATFVENRLSDLRLALVLELATVTGAVAGGIAAGFIAASAVALLFGLFTVYVGSQMLWARAVLAERSRQGEFRNLRLGLSGSFVAGGLSALLGVGGGPLKVPLMSYGMGVPFKVAAATSNLMIGVTAAASVTIYALRGTLQLGLVAPLVVGVLLGAGLGAKVMLRAPTAILKRLFGLLLLAVGVQMLLEGGRALWGAH
jgi:uncharacterized protein